MFLDYELSYFLIHREYYFFFQFHIFKVRVIIFNYFIYALIVQHPFFYSLYK